MKFIKKTNILQISPHISRKVYIKWTGDDEKTIEQAGEGGKRDGEKLEVIQRWSAIYRV